MAAGIKWFFQDYIKTYIQYMAAGFAAIPFATLYAWLSITHRDSGLILLAPLAFGFCSALIAWHFVGVLIDRRRALTSARQIAGLTSGTGTKTMSDSRFPAVPRQHS
jgi:hypothetical protein